ARAPAGRADRLPGGDRAADGVHRRGPGVQAGRGTGQVRVRPVRDGMRPGGPRGTDLLAVSVRDRAERLDCWPPFLVSTWGGSASFGVSSGVVRRTSIHDDDKVITSSRGRGAGRAA